MADIVMDFLVKAPAERVFQEVSTGHGLGSWWTKRSTGEAKLGAPFELHFGTGYDWRATVTRCTPHSAFELQVVAAQEDWLDTRVGFALEAKGQTTTVHFHHTGWPTANEHWRGSVYCWAMYLRIMRRAIEHGESVPYERRLDV
jgi:uncharacterized protein YndB with AHSA1/START domain